MHRYTGEMYSLFWHFCEIKTHFDQLLVIHPKCVSLKWILLLQLSFLIYRRYCVVLQSDNVLCYAWYRPCQHRIGDFVYSYNKYAYGPFMCLSLVPCRYTLHALTTGFNRLCDWFWLIPIVDWNQHVFCPQLIIILVRTVVPELVGVDRSPRLRHHGYDGRACWRAGRVSAQPCAVVPAWLGQILRRGVTDASRVSHVTYSHRLTFPDNLHAHLTPQV